MKPLLFPVLLFLVLLCLLCLLVLCTREVCPVCGGPVYFYHLRFCRCC